jgi:hypothetical protein
LKYDLPPDPIAVADGGSSQAPLPPFQNLTATIKGGDAEAGAVTVAFDDEFGRNTQDVFETEIIRLSDNPDRVVVESGAKPADLLIDAADQLNGKDVLDFSQYGGRVFLADGQKGQVELYSDEKLANKTGLRFEHFEEIKLTSQSDLVNTRTSVATLDLGGGDDTLRAAGIGTRVAGCAWFGCWHRLFASSVEAVPTGRTMTMQPLETGTITGIHVQDGDQMTAATADSS